MKTKKVNLNLVGIDGNAFSIMSAFKKQARKEGWVEEEINDVIKKAQEGDYKHLIRTIMENCK